MGIHSEMADRHSLPDRWAGRKTDRQIDGQTDGQMTDRQKYVQTHGLMDGERKSVQMDRQTNGKVDR
jgi:hypothetical protein